MGNLQLATWTMNDNAFAEKVRMQLHASCKCAACPVSLPYNWPGTKACHDTTVYSRDLNRQVHSSH